MAKKIAAAELDDFRGYIGQVARHAVESGDGELRRRRAGRIDALLLRGPFAAIASARARVGTLSGVCARANGLAEPWRIARTSGCGARAGAPRRRFAFARELVRMPDRVWLRQVGLRLRQQESLRCLSLTARDLPHGAPRGYGAVLL